VWDRSLCHAHTSWEKGCSWLLPLPRWLMGSRFFLMLTLPVQWAVDLVTAVLLFVMLCWQWILLLGLIMEAIPGLYVFPFWVLVVGAVAMWGTARAKLDGQTKNRKVNTKRRS